MKDWLVAIVCTLGAVVFAVSIGLAVTRAGYGPVRCGFKPTKDISAYETSIILMYSLHEDCAGLGRDYPEIWQKYMRNIP